MKRITAFLLSAILCLSLCACFGLNTRFEVREFSKLDMSRWYYNSRDDVYYQLGLTYCAAPVNTTYQTLAVFVPGAFLTGRKNGSGTYSCTLSDSAVNGYTGATAPVILSAGSIDFEPVKGPNNYTKAAAEFTEKGFIFVRTGHRGCDAGAPAGVTDLKAAVRFLRYNAELLPGDTERIFVLGTGSGGGEAAILGASGDSGLYEPYLKEIGAAMSESDAVCGAICYNPQTDFGTANAGYEWLFGQKRTGLSTEEQQLSDGLANAWAEYINAAGFKDADGNVLTLEASAEGIYQAGSYYDHVKMLAGNAADNYTGTGSESSGLLPLCAFDRLNCAGTLNRLFSTEVSGYSHFDSILCNILNETGNEKAAEFAADFESADSHGNTVADRVKMYSPLYFLLETSEGNTESGVAEYWYIDLDTVQNGELLTSAANLALALNSRGDAGNVKFETSQSGDGTGISGSDIDNIAAWINYCVTLMR